MIEILEKWNDETYPKKDYYRSNEGDQLTETYWYWNIYDLFLLDLMCDLEHLKAHDSPQNKRAAMLNKVNSEAFLSQEAFPMCIERKDKIKAQAHIDVSLRAKELFTAWDPTGDPIRKYKVFRRD